MKETPILFSGPMIRAILEGRKTMTRRLDPSLWYAADPFTEAAKCPYGQPGDRLWVRETWRCNGTCGGPRITYKEDDEERWFENAPKDSPLWIADDDVWRPSIFMPLWASRITLEITSIRVERVQDITEEDAKAEGANRDAAYDDPDLQYESTCGEDRGAGAGYFCPRSYVDGFRNLWDSLNSKRGFGWEANPWVWVVGFRRVEK